MMLAFIQSCSPSLEALPIAAFSANGTEAFGKALIGLAITIAIAWIVVKCLASRNNREAAEEHSRTLDACARADFRQKLKALEKSGGSLPAIPSERVPVMLKDGESAYWLEATELYETRDVQRSTAFGGSLPVFDGIYVHSGEITSRTSQEWQRIASGSLVLTNERVIFDGDTSNRSIPLAEIFSTSGGPGIIEVSAESCRETMVFKSRNGYYVAWLIKQLRNVSANPGVAANGGTHQGAGGASPA